MTGKNRRGRNFRPRLTPCKKCGQDFLKTVQGKSGDWYCMARIAPPRDGDGGECG